MFESKGLHWLCCSVNKVQKQGSLDVKDKSKSLYQQMLVKWISAGVRWDVSNTWLLLFLWVQIMILHLITCHNLQQKYITLSRVPLQMFQQCCRATHTVPTLIFNYTDSERMSQHLFPCTVFLTCEVLSILVTILVFPSLGTCIIQCLPVQNIHMQATTIFLNIHVTS
jgi:hypothetical protein